jgi:cardiolipin-specific phospholipase
MLSIQPTSPAIRQDDKTNQPPTTVVLHGYGAGLGFFSLNLESLSSWSSNRGLPIYLLDWLGMGRSSRPPFKITAKYSDTRARVEQAESFFLDSLEEWRVKMGIEKMTLVGHSLGAYLVTAYALKWPERVARLVLLSPAGVNRGEGSSAPDAELTRSRSNPGPAETRGAGTEVSPNQKNEDIQKMQREQEEEKGKRRESWGRRLVSYWLVQLSTLRIPLLLFVPGPFVG